MEPMQRYKLLLATVMPRPIAWVTTRDSGGAINAAPFSFFNMFGSDPATVGLGIGSRAPGEPKDTRANIRLNEQFVVNLGAVRTRTKNAHHLNRVPERRGRARRGRTDSDAVRTGGRPIYRG